MGSSERRETFPMVQSSKLNLYPPKNIDLCCDFSSFFCRFFLILVVRLSSKLLVEVPSFRNTLLMYKVQATIYGRSHLHPSWIRYFRLFSTIPTFSSNHCCPIKESLFPIVPNCIVRFSLKTLQISHKINLLWLLDLTLQLHLATARSYFVFPAVFGIPLYWVHDGILISWLIKQARNITG